MLKLSALSWGDYLGGVNVTRARIHKRGRQEALGRRSGGSGREVRATSCDSGGRSLQFWRQEQLLPGVPGSQQCSSRESKFMMFEAVKCAGICHSNRKLTQGSRSIQGFKIPQSNKVNKNKVKPPR